VNHLSLHCPQGLKPGVFKSANGTAKAVPSPSIIYQNSLKSFSIFAIVMFHIAMAASAETVRGTVIRNAGVFLTPDTSSAKLVEVKRGQELIVLETTPGWVHVEAMITPGSVDEAFQDDIPTKTITGWVPDKGMIRGSTPNGDRVLYGEAVDSEDQGSRSHGRRGAAQDAMRLYYSVAEYFPTSPLAAEAMYRSADIRWQIEKIDIMSKPSAKEQEAYLRGSMQEKYMKEVMKKYPGTKWADLAAFHLIENKLCGDWQGEAKCPEKEADIYEKFAADHSQSSVAAEALYDAAWRYAALIEIYKTGEQAKKSDDAKFKATTLTQKVLAQFPQSDWAPRAQRLQYMIDQSIPTYGREQD